MPNDRAKTSILRDIDLKKYPKLSQFLTAQTLSNKKDIQILSNNQALDLLEEAIGEVEDQRSKPTASLTRASRQKELDQSASKVISESIDDSLNSEKLSQTELQPIAKQESQIEKQTSSEQPVSAEAVKSSESAEIAEIGQELAEIKEDDKEQEEKLAKKQQAAIDQLANQAQTSPKQVKPVVVLPITERQKEQAKKKGVHFSLRWLAEWAEKIKKIFSGAVLYKEEVENSADV
jgi:hypothetical protein